MSHICYLTKRVFYYSQDNERKLGVLQIFLADDSIPQRNNCLWGLPVWLWYRDILEWLQSNPSINSIYIKPSNSYLQLK